MGTTDAHRLKIVRLSVSSSGRVPPSSGAGRAAGKGLTFSEPSAASPSVAWGEGPAAGAPAELLVTSATSHSISNSSGVSPSMAQCNTSSFAIVV